MLSVAISLIPSDFKIIPRSHKDVFDIETKRRREEGRSSSHYGSDLWLYEYSPTLSFISFVDSNYR